MQYGKTAKEQSVNRLDQQVCVFVAIDLRNMNT